jgi:hypothetical protein
VMGRTQAKIERGGPGVPKPALRQVGSTKRSWPNAVVASAYEGEKALHALVIQLLYGQTIDGLLHEHCNR